MSILLFILDERGKCPFWPIYMGWVQIITGVTLNNVISSNNLL